MRVSKQFRFEASHQIHNHPGKCARLHGHSWLLTVECEGLVKVRTGMVIDYFDIKQAVQPIVDSLDHQHLGSGTVTIGSGSLVFLGPSTELSLPSLPTSENLLLWLGDQLRKTSPDFTWSRLTLNETCTSSAELTFEEWRTFYNATH